jgi:hypothetical protein
MRSIDRATGMNDQTRIESRALRRTRLGFCENFAETIRRLLYLYAAAVSFMAG